jgi:excinuclease ABC subunit B
LLALIQFAEPEEKIKKAIKEISKELEEHAPKLDLLERQRLEKRTKYDLEMLQELGYCSGIENYSRHFDERLPGERPYVLLDYFPKDFLFIIDESHQSIPQSRAMFKGDFARKKSLVDFGFRLPCAYDNRPLKFEEFEKFFNNTVFVSATPADWELKKSSQVVNLIQRPTGLLDPLIEMRPISNQIPDVIKEIGKTVAEGNRILITVLTKKMAEDLTSYLAKEDVKVRYMHSDVGSLDRIELIRQLRVGEFDVLVGINLLREGLDLPEVSLIAIMDADKEGFLRDERSLIQTIGRASRNEKGRVILYADIVTNSIKKAVAITKTRRAKQEAYNKKMNIVPRSVQKTVPEKTREIRGIKHMAKGDIGKKLAELDAKMRKAAEELDFEKAIELRDTISSLERELNAR